MPNTNYVSGRRFEYDRKKIWEENGYTVLRTAGSHGQFDLIAFQPDKPPCFIQCKITKSQATATRMIERFRKDTRISETYNQLLEIKVRGKAGIMYAEV